MITRTGRTICAHGKRVLAAWLRPLRLALGDLRKELALLNRARLPLSEEGLPRGDRVRMVKAALASHHEPPSRCC